LINEYPKVGTPKWGIRRNLLNGRELVCLQSEGSSLAALFMLFEC